MVGPLTASDLLCAGVVFAFALAIFLAGCAVGLLITEPSDDPFSDASEWDGPQLPSDFESLFHDERI